MDSGLIPWNLTAIFALIMPVIFVLIKQWKKSKSVSAKLPPGPKLLPIIGNLHLVVSPPFRSFRDLAKRYGPIMHLKLGEVPVVVVSSPELAKEILRDNEPNFADRPAGIAFEIMWYNYRNIAFCPYGGYWRQMRKICINEFLSPRNVRSFGSIRKDEVSRLIEAIRLSSRKEEPVNLTEKVLSMTSSITCRAAFGKACKDSDALIKFMTEGMRMASGIELADLFPSSRIVKALSWRKLRLVMMRRKLNAILDDIINAHRENLARMATEDGQDSSRRGNGEFGNEDLVDVLLRIKESGELEFPIGNDNIKAVLHDMFSGGTDTSSTAIDWAMTELVRNPSVMAKAQAEVRQVFTGSDAVDVEKLKYLKLVIKETLRLHPPFPILPRASREEREIGGYTIPAKTRVLVNNWALQRDPKHWTDPERFEPERFENQAAPLEFTGGDFQFLPFGSGRRMCPGMAFGLANVELPLAGLLYNFDWQLPDGVDADALDMVENPGLTAPRKDNLFVVATPYEPLPATPYI